MLGLVETLFSSAFSPLVEQGDTYTSLSDKRSIKGTGRRKLEDEEIDD